MSWRPAPSITALQGDLDLQCPGRTKPDWIIGDADHSSRTSDHNPDPKGMVHAIDIRLGGGLDAKAVLNATIGDERVWYVIHNGIIYSRTYGWQALRYTGKNPHTTHVHVSIRYTAAAENDTSPWFPAEKKRTRPIPVDLSTVREEFLNALNGRPVTERVHVKRLQRALNQKHPDHKITVDGLAGKETLNAWGRHERASAGLARPRIPDAKSLAALVQPRYVMKK
jgi:hypothetical protein